MPLLNNNNVIKQHKIINVNKTSEIVTKLPKPHEDIEYDPQLFSEDMTEQVTQLNNLKSNILSQAQVEAEQLKQQAIQVGHETGFHQGYEEGLAQGKVQAQQMIAQANANLANTVDSVNQYTHNKQEELVEFAIQMAQILIKEQLKIAPETILKILEPILLKLEEPDEFIKIKAHPRYHVLLAEKLAQQKINLGNLRYILLDDESLATDHVVVESNAAVTVVDIEAELNKFMQEIKSQE